MFEQSLYADVQQYENSEILLVAQEKKEKLCQMRGYYKFGEIFILYLYLILIQV